jgi:hypothetical protein
VQATKAKGKMSAVKRMNGSICCMLDAPVRVLAQEMLGSEQVFR